MVGSDGSESAKEGPETTPDEEAGCKPSSKSEGTGGDSLFFDLERAKEAVLFTQPILDPAHVINVDVFPLAPLPLDETPVTSVSNSVRLRLCGAGDSFVVLPLGRSLCRSVVEYESSSDSEPLSSELDRNLVYMYVTTTRRLHTMRVIEIYHKQN